MIVPHHLLVKDWMEKFYEEQSLKYSIASKASERGPAAGGLPVEGATRAPIQERVILLSPNHFGYGYDWIQSTDIQPGQDIIPGEDVWPPTLPLTSLVLDGRRINRLALEKVISIEPIYFYREHGITAEFPFIERFFYGAYILPITFKEGTPQAKLDALVDELIMLMESDPRPTLVIASIDFTHLEEEKYALQNDERTIKMLESLDNTPDVAPPTLDALRALALTTNPSPLNGAAPASGAATAMDSPETLYVLLQLMHRAEKTSFTLWARTSSASLIPGLPAQDNTSHIFGSFN